MKTLSDKRIADPFTHKVILKEEDVKEFIKQLLDNITDGCGCYECGSTLSEFTLRQLAGDKLI